VETRGTHSKIVDLEGGGEKWRGEGSKKKEKKKKANRPRDIKTLEPLKEGKREGQVA